MGGPSADGSPRCHGPHSTKKRSLRSIEAVVNSGPIHKAVGGTESIPSLRDLAIQWGVLAPGVLAPLGCCAGLLAFGLATAAYSDALDVAISAATGLPPWDRTPISCCFFVLPGLLELLG
jgi:hypothetical protein